MKLIDYIRTLTPAEREALAGSCQTSAGHLNNVAYGLRTCSPLLASQLEAHSRQAVRRWDLCPDEWHLIWPELRADAAAPPIPAASAVRGGTAASPDGRCVQTAHEVAA